MGRMKRLIPFMLLVLIQIAEPPLHGDEVSFVGARRDYLGGGVSLVRGDFNNDGIFDLATADLRSDAVSILLGTKGGFFELPRTLPVGRSPNHVVSGDFNGDGHLDLATVNGLFPPYPKTLSILLGHGDGTFQTRTSDLERYAWSLAVGDFDRDGVLDLVIVEFDDRTVSILLGQGDGTFQPFKRFVVGDRPHEVCVADFNRDSVPDLAVANSSSSTVSVLLGSGDGDFQPASHYQVDPFCWSVYAADVNGDGMLDLVTAHPRADVSGLSILFGRGDGSFQPPTLIRVGVGRAPRYLAFGDFNSDEILDIVSNDSNSSGVIWMLMGTGGGNFQLVGNFVAGGGDELIAADFNADGKLDLAVTGGRVSILIGDGLGGFFNTPAIPVPAGPTPMDIVTEDFNNDGHVDMAVSSNGGQASVYLGMGEGRFAEPTTYFVGPSAHLGVGDFNGDGRADLVVGSVGGGAQAGILYGDGEGGFQPVVTIPLISGKISVLAMIPGDFNRDGLSDLAVTFATGLSGRGPGYVAIFINEGDNRFPRRALFQTGP